METPPSLTPAPAKTYWLVILTILLAPSLLTVVSGDAAPVTATYGSAISGIICGTMLVWRLERPLAIKIGRGIALAVGFGMASFCLSCFGCLLSGFKW